MFDVRNLREEETGYPGAILSEEGLILARYLFADDETDEARAYTLYSIPIELMVRA